LEEVWMPINVRWKGDEVGGSYKNYGV